MIKTIRFVYPNTFMSNCIPISLAKLISVAINRTHCYSNIVFHHTTFIEEGINVNEVKNRIYGMGKQILEKKFEIHDKSIDLDHWLNHFIHNCIESDDVIAISIVEDTWPFAKRMIQKLGVYSINVVIGGPFVTASYDIIKDKLPNNVSCCIGDGMSFFGKYLDIVSSMESGQVIKIVDNGITSSNELDSCVSAYNHIPQVLGYRFINKILQKVIPVEINRGCPFNCSYCINSKHSIQFKQRSITDINLDLQYIKTFGPDLIYFIGDVFLKLENLKQLDTLSTSYWMNTRPELIPNDEYVNYLLSTGCVRCNIGLEHGDDVFRHHMLNRKMRNEDVLRVAKMFKNTTINLVVNSIIGFPTENTELLQKTLDMNKQILDINPNVTLSPFICTPYHGTKLKDYCVEHGLMKKNQFVAKGLIDSGLNVSDIPTNLLLDVHHNFMEYVTGEKKL